MEWTIPRFEIENDPTWISSIGADQSKLHWRKGKFHAICDPEDDNCLIHEDKQNKVGAIGIGLLTLYALDKTFNKGALTKQVRKELGI